MYASFLYILWIFSLNMLWYIYYTVRILHILFISVYLPFRKIIKKYEDWNRKDVDEDKHSPEWSRKRYKGDEEKKTSAENAYQWIYWNME